MKVSVNGSKVYCYTNSRDIDRDKQTIFFIHGAGMDHTVWTLAARHFARHNNNVISADLPNHGRSEGSALSSVKTMSKWVIQLLDVLELERAALVGHSLGSLIALECAASQPERVRAIALVGATSPMPVSQAILNAAKADDHAAFDMLTQWGFSKRHQYGGNRNSGIWMIGNTLRLYERCRSGVLYQDMTACNEYKTGLEQAKSIECPALMLLGSEDRLTPIKGTLALQQALPNPIVKILPGAGHTIMMEAPNAMLDALHSVL